MKYFSILPFLFLTMIISGQNKEPLTPEKLWELGRVGAKGLTKDKNFVLFSVTTPDIKENDFHTKYYKIKVDGGVAIPVSKEFIESQTAKMNTSGTYKLVDEKVKLKNVAAVEYYQDLPKSQGKLYTSLDHRHWDKWMDGNYNHVFIESVKDTSDKTDIMKGLPYYCPQEPFGGSEDYIWSADGNSVFYVTKAKEGTDYVQSTNTDIYKYDIKTGKTTNLTAENKGYDMSPQVNSDNVLAYLSMKTEGYEADKNDIIILKNGKRTNLTKDWDGTVFGFIWNNKGDKIYFTAPTEGTIQVFEIEPFISNPKVRQLTEGIFDITAIVGQSDDDKLIVTRTTMNRASEIYTLNLRNNKLSQLTKVNENLYAKIEDSKVERRYITTIDGKKMLTWVIYPPNFDPQKKYPTLLYCQGGPQSALTQFYSFRWNFQLMAAEGYIVVAPNRRGMPGFGVEWNEQISKDWGGQPMQDYLSAIDAIAKEPYVDENRLGAVGASYGGYSVFNLAGIHQKRFKTLIAHCGVFNTRSMFGTTEEVFFTNYDLGGPYWQKNEDTQKAYHDFNPIEKVAQWDTPILIIQGGKDYRVPEEQGLQAFTAAQLLGIKSEFLYFPNENHWVLEPQNGIFWQRNFFRWLKETL